MNKSELVKNTWENVWHNSEEIQDWDDLSQNILDILISEVQSAKLSGSGVVEVGCGTGRISLALAKRGFKVSILDISPAALQIARHFFEKNKAEANFIEGDMFEMPFPDNTFDLVWNAGVLEHFSHGEQKKALQEMGRICKPGGLIITMNPYAGGVFYRIGKFIKEIRGKWVFGYECPVNTLRKVCPEGLKITKEFVTGELVQLVGFPKGHRIYNFVKNRIPEYSLPLWKKLFGGYLLVTVVVKT